MRYDACPTSSVGSLTRGCQGIHLNKLLHVPVPPPLASLPNQHLWTSRQSTSHAGTCPTNSQQQLQHQGTCNKALSYSIRAHAGLLTCPNNNSSSIRAQQCPRVSPSRHTHRHHHTCPNNSSSNLQAHSHASEHQCPQHTYMPKQQLQQSTACHAGTLTCPTRAPAIEHINVLSSQCKQSHTQTTAPASEHSSTPCRNTHTPNQ